MLCPGAELFLPLALVLLVKVSDARRKVVMLSFDGFRWDYIGRYNTPNFNYIASHGVHARIGMRTAFVTKTFPDHYTIATGLYEESHGIVNNKMYDPEFDEQFTPGNLDPKWWDGGEPIWITATLQGLKTGTYFWPGSEVKLKDVNPTVYVPYNKSHPFNVRIEKVVEWLSREDLDLVLAYFHQPDATGHKYGAFSRKVGESVAQMDTLLGFFIESLRKVNLFDNIDLLLVSDHGMANVTQDEEHAIVLENYLDFEKEVKLLPQEGSLAAILPKEGMVDSVYEKLKNAHPHMTVYRKEDIPDKYHYKNHRRIMPIIALADEGYQILKTRPADLGGSVYGEHGYDNNLRSMRPIFFAIGPDFKQNYISSGFDTVNIYPLICHLLEISPAPNNGSLTNVKDMLRSSASWTIYSLPVLVVPAIGLALETLYFIMASS